MYFNDDVFVEIHKTGLQLAESCYSSMVTVYYKDKICINMILKQECNIMAKSYLVIGTVVGYELLRALTVN